MHYAVDPGHNSPDNYCNLVAYIATGVPDEDREYHQGDGHGKRSFTVTNTRNGNHKDYGSMIRRQLINCQPSRLVNSDCTTLIPALKATRTPARATPEFESIGPPARARNPPPLQGGNSIGHVPGALPRAGMLRAVGASWRT